MTDLTTLLAGIKERAEQVPECNEDCGMVSCRTLKDRDRLIQALEAVTALHKPESDPLHIRADIEFCAHCGDEWPCPTITAVVAALGGRE